MTIHKEGYPTLFFSFALLAILCSACYYFFPKMFTLIFIISAILYIFLISFFRKPDRNVLNPDKTALLSPCDGKIVVIEKVFEPEILNRECTQVSIFMSPLNVHINWFPSDAEVTHSIYHPGKYLAAWNPKASTENERTTVCYSINDKSVLLRQVAGALARRIVCYAKENTKYQQGEELGFIKFGSRVDLYLPSDSKLLVNIGDKVSGNVTKLATLI
ncbi:MAG: phosphatidylserine decarboxylase family protein [Saprospiraceae bacterium]|nr:phosphatidylserine decarboxylase family protein [Saprospiraceae bacterium]MBK9566543.1 phosphatidylserine decarboxylase family protein [Saprospiraceae bacterium]